MSNLIKGLRHWAEHYHNADLDEAADEIERLRAALDEIESYGGAQGVIARDALETDDV